MHDQSTLNFVICEQCDIPFRVRPYKLQSARYCSRTCQNRAKTRPDRRGAITTKSCQVCGSIFRVKPHRALEAQFCSNACSGIAKQGGAPIADRFWPKVEKTDGCWLWTGARLRGGYGKITTGGSNGKGRSAHRVSWEIHYGPIPDSLWACHTCDVPSCVNPAHLFLGTQQENTDDMVAKHRHATGERNGSARLCAKDVESIRASSEPIKTLAKHYGVHRTTIHGIRSGRKWRGV